MTYSVGSATAAAALVAFAAVGGFEFQQGSEPIRSPQIRLHGLPGPAQVEQAEVQKPVTRIAPSTPAPPAVPKGEVHGWRRLDLAGMLGVSVAELDAFLRMTRAR